MLTSITLFMFDKDFIEYCNHYIKFIFVEQNCNFRSRSHILCKSNSLKDGSVFSVFTCIKVYSVTPVKCLMQRLDSPVWFAFNLMYKKA